MSFPNKDKCQTGIASHPGWARKKMFHSRLPKTILKSIFEHKICLRRVEDLNQILKN